MPHKLAFLYHLSNGTPNCDTPSLIHVENLLSKPKFITTDIRGHIASLTVNWPPVSSDCQVSFLVLQKKKKKKKRMDPQGLASQFQVGKKVPLSLYFHTIFFGQTFPIFVLILANSARPWLRP